MIAARVAGVPEALLLHRLAQLIVLDEFSGAFHRAKQRRFREARGRPRVQRFRVGLLRAHRFTGLHRDQARRVLRAFVLRFLAVDGEPAGPDEYLALALEAVAFGHAKCAS